MVVVIPLINAVAASLRITSIVVVIPVISGEVSHLFFTSKIALAFTTGTSAYAGSATGSGNMKYILGT
jgi:hypothetical protein